MRHIMICPVCHEYSMKEACTCGQKLVDPKPPKYSPDDKYAEVKREIKDSEYKKRGLV